MKELQPFPKVFTFCSPSSRAAFHRKKAARRGRNSGLPRSVSVTCGPDARNTKRSNSSSERSIMPAEQRALGLTSSSASVRYPFPGFRPRVSIFPVQKTNLDHRHSPPQERNANGEHAQPSSSSANFPLPQPHAHRRGWRHPPGGPSIQQAGLAASSFVDRGKKIIKNVTAAKTKPRAAHGTIILQRLA